MIHKSKIQPPKTTTAQINLSEWHPTPALLPGKSHERRSLVGCGPWGRWELDMTQWLHFHFSLSSTGEGNGNSLQCSCLENPRDGGAWWAAVYGVAQSQTRLKRLSSSSSSSWINHAPQFRAKITSLAHIRPFLLFFNLVPSQEPSLRYLMSSQDICFKEMETNYSILTWRILQTEEPGGL